MRAGRLIEMMLILQARGRVTAPELADELEVSVRTVLRDLEALSGAGVPVYATRGPQGGFQLVEGYDTDLVRVAGTRRRTAGAGHARRATVRITPEGRQLATLLGRLQPLRIRRQQADPGSRWLTATFRLDAVDAAVADVLSLGHLVEVVAPPDLRREVASRIREAAALYAGADADLLNDE